MYYSNIIITIYHIFADSKTEMDKLEDQFVTGKWVPPGITPVVVAPTTKKQKRKQIRVKCKLFILQLQVPFYLLHLPLQ